MAENNATTREMTVVVWPRLSQYIGSKAMLEAEGINPKAWPKGFDFTNWQDDVNSYSLRRERPEGAKGPRRAFADVDWWCFTWEPLNRPSYDELVIARKQKELRAALYEQSPEGRMESRKRFNRYCESVNDGKFQAFKSLLGLVPPKRERKAKSTSTENTGGN